MQVRSVGSSRFWLWVQVNFGPDRNRIELLFGLACISIKSVYMWFEFDILHVHISYRILDNLEGCYIAVSYTHLTLPTKRIV